MWPLSEKRDGVSRVPPYPAHAFQLTRQACSLPQPLYLHPYPELYYGEKKVKNEDPKDSSR